MATPGAGTEAKVVGAPQFSLSRTDLPTLLKGAAIAVAGALLAYAVTYLLPLLETSKYVWLAPLLAILVNIGQKWLLNTQKLEIPLDARTGIITPQEAAQPPVAPTVIIVPPETPPGIH